jgi:hypothetical protein
MTASQISTPVKVKCPTLHLYHYVLRNSINEPAERLNQRRQDFNNNLKALASQLTTSSGQTADNVVTLVPLDKEPIPSGTVLDFTNASSSPDDHLLDLSDGIFSRFLAAIRLNDTYVLRFTSYVSSEHGEQPLQTFANLRENIAKLPLYLGQTVILAGICQPSQHSSKDIAAECLSIYYGTPIAAGEIIEDNFLDSPFYLYLQRVPYKSGNIEDVKSIHFTCVFLYKDENTEGIADGVYAILKDLLLSYHKIEFFYSQSRVFKKTLAKQYEAIERLTEDYTQQQWNRQSLTKLPQDSLEYYKSLSFLKDQYRTIQVNFTNYKNLLKQIKEIGQVPKFFRDFEKKIGNYLEQIKTDIGFLSPGIQLYEKLMLSVQTQVSIDESARQDRQDKLAQILTGAGTALAIGQIINTPITTSVSQVIDKSQPQPSVSSLWLGAGLTILLSLLAGWGVSVIVYKWFTKEK